MLIYFKLSAIGRFLNPAQPSFVIVAKEPFTNRVHLFISAHENDAVLASFDQDGVRANARVEDMPPVFAYELVLELELSTEENGGVGGSKLVLPLSLSETVSPSF